MTLQQASIEPLHLGSCLCGAVRYEARAGIRAVSHCHCSMCRKAHGAAFASYGAVPLAQFTFLSGADRLRSYASSPEVTRRFCGTCGSCLTWQRHAGDFSNWICLALGTLDTPFTPARQRHVHFACAVPWLAAGQPPSP